MPVESSADRLLFLSAAEFGVTATYTPVSGGSSSSVAGIFDKEYLEVAGEGEAAVSTTHPIFVCRSVDLTSGGLFDDQLMIDAVSYKVKVIRPDGTGMTTMFLEQQ